MAIEHVRIDKIVMNPSNPRFIKDDKFKKLIKSIKEFPEMLEVRPIVVDNDMVVLGGNMRLKACYEAGLEIIPIIKFKDIDDAKKAEFIVKDNIGYGEWDWDLLLEDWEKDMLIDWGMDIPKKTFGGGDVLGEIEFTDELMLEHNYVVLYFDNVFDWEVAMDKLGLEKKKSLAPDEKSQKVGIGRVINGRKIIDRL